MKIIKKTISDILTKRNSICIIVAFYFLNGNCYSQSCSDSIKNNILSSTSFQPSLTFDLIPTSDNGTMIYQSSPSENKISFFKADKNGNPLWAKNYKQSQTILWQNVHEMDNGNFIMNSNTKPFCNTCLISDHLIIDANGNYIFQDDYNNQQNDDGWQVANSGSNQSIVFAGVRTNTNGGGIIVSRLDTLFDQSILSQQLIWSANYSFDNYLSTSISITYLHVVNNFVYIGGTFIGLNSPSNIGFWILKIDYSTGQLISHKSYYINNSTASQDSLALPLKSEFISSSANHFSFSIDVLRDNGSAIKETVIIQLNNNLEVLGNSIAISSPLAYSQIYPSFSKSNKGGTTAYFTLKSNSEIYCAFVDSNNINFEQRKITTTNNGTWFPSPLLKDNNAITQVLEITQHNNFFFQLENVPTGFSNISGCPTIKDTNFAYIRPILCRQAALNWNRGPDVYKASIALAQKNSSEDLVLNSEAFCQQTSLCDSLKINGRNNFCFSDSMISFMATKNSSCFKKINWLADTSFVSSFVQVNDSTASFQFKKTGTINLYASITGCGLTDSLLLNIKPPSKTVDIGNDSTLCPNTTDTLRTKSSYQKYPWQDGSTDSFFVVKKSGMYKLTATDMCDNVSADSVVIKYDENKLSAGMDIELCKLQDTSLTASNGFSDYQWQPVSEVIGSSLSQTIHISPIETTTYIVTAESTFGCAFSDTVKAIVNNCWNRLVVPSAFSPNGDGKNESLKPIVYGILQKYDFGIYNRWGQLVFHSSKQGDGWDGKIGNVLQDGGAYVWFCRYQFSGEKEKNDKGTFLLLK